MRGWGSRFGAERPQRCGALSRRSRKLPAGTRGQPRLFCSRCRTARARLPPSGAPHRATRAAPLARVRHLPLLRVSASCPAVRGPAPARPPPPAPPARWGHAPAAAVGSGSAAAAVAPLLAPARGFPDGTGRSGGPGHHTRTQTHTHKHAPAGSRRTSRRLDPRWRPLESAAAAARGCCCRRTGSRSHGSDRSRCRARENPTSCCRRRPPRCRTSRRVSVAAEGCPLPDPRSRRAAARRSAPPWPAPGGTAREDRPQPLSAHLRRPRPVLWERPPAAPGASPRRPPPRAALRSDGSAVPRNSALLGTPPGAPRSAV